MTHAPKKVISASRRTDIPAFYMEWFMEQIKNGFFELTNPYNGKRSTLAATAETVHTIVFWSKNFGPFIKNGFGQKLIETGYNLFFNFTINPVSPLLEPNVPSLEERFDQLDYLCENFDKRCINWRFDPICFYSAAENGPQNNLDGLSIIAKRASSAGISRCITSFMDHYRKVKNRVASIPGFFFIDPPMQRKKEITLGMEKELSSFDISLQTCCEKELLEAMPDESSVTNSSCIPNDLIAEIYGGRLSMKKDTGQRVKDGCGCRVSVDIGSYRQHPCYHNCLFCYANPSSGK
jgi:hypothetical protein